MFCAFHPLSYALNYEKASSCANVASKSSMFLAKHAVPDRQSMSTFTRRLEMLLAYKETGSYSIEHMKS